MTHTITIKQLNPQKFAIMVIYNDSSDFKEKLQNYQEYIGALEEERRKIQVFERELPLCLDLVSRTIERCRRQTSSEGPVLEEFLPIKQVSSTNEYDNDDDQKQHLYHKSEVICSKDKSSPYSLKSDWLTSAQLSIQVRDPPKEEDFLSKKLVDVEANKNASGGFLPFQKKTSVSSSADTETDGGGGSGSKGEDKGQSNKKERRCWSSDLHRLFLTVLQELGGAHVATPKQIRELMKVDGLTNDEIKSHLQKYRLHTRRINPSIHDTHTPQLVVVGRLWMPPSEYTSQLTDNTNDTKSVYTPTA